MINQLIDFSSQDLVEMARGLANTHSGETKLRLITISEKLAACIHSGDEKLEKKLREECFEIIANS